MSGIKHLSGRLKALAFLLLPAILWTAGCDTDAAAASGGGKSAKQPEGKKSKDGGITGNPVTDAANALRNHDYRFRAIKDEQGKMVIPGIRQSQVQDFGYSVQHTMLQGPSGGLTNSQRVSMAEKVFYYAASYNTTVFNYMRDHPLKK